MKPCSSSRPGPPDRPPNGQPGQSAVTRGRRELRLTDIMAPFSLLLCRNALFGLEPGDEIDVLMADPSALADLILIIERSPDRILEKRREGDCFRVRIRKGGAIDSAPPSDYDQVD